MKLLRLLSGRAITLVAVFGISIASTGCTGTHHSAMWANHSVPDQTVDFVCCLSPSSTQVSASEQTYVSLQRLADEETEAIEGGGVLQFLLSVTNTSIQPLTFDPEQQISAYPAISLHGADRSASNQSLHSSTPVELSVVRRSAIRTTTKNLTFIPTQSVRPLVEKRSEYGEFVHGLPYLVNVLEDVVRSKRKPDVTDYAEVIRLKKRASILATSKGTIDPGQKVSSTLALDLGEKSNFAEVSILVDVGGHKHTFVFEGLDKR